MFQERLKQKRSKEEKTALFRFDPRRAEEGKNPFQLDSKAPTTDYKEFIERFEQHRYIHSSLQFLQDLSSLHLFLQQQTERLHQ